MKSGLIAAIVGGLIAVGCAGSGAGSGSSAPISGLFMGVTRNNGDSVAILADPPVSGTSRNVHVYVTDGLAVSEQFSGVANGNIFTLSNADGSVSGTIDSVGVQGKLNIPSSSFTFTATKSSSIIAGLYSVTVDKLGKTVSGTSTTGQTLAGNIQDPVNNKFAVFGQISPSGGAPGTTGFSGSITQDSAGPQFWIVLPSPNPLIRGGAVSGQGAGFFEGFSNEQSP